MLQNSYVPGVDGLRFVAVFSVLLFHAELFSAGWGGVWLFFVISGFVITRSLLDESKAALGARRILAHFYLKRAFRILPLYLAAVAAFSLICFVVTWFQPPQIVLSRNSLVYTDHLPYLLTFTYNFYRMDSSYLPSSFFSHFWSLSVEEQFYLFYPILLIGLSIARLPRALLVGLVIFPCVRLLIGMIYADSSVGLDSLEVMPERAGNAVYQFSFGHFDAFAAGALVALYETRIRASKRVLTFLALVSLFAICTYLFIYVRLLGGFWKALAVNIYGYHAEVWLYSVLNLLFATLVVAVLKGFTPLEWLCTRSLPLFLGRISFGIYVWHMPIFRVLGRRLEPTVEAALARHDAAFLARPMLFFGLSALTVLVSYISFRIYEKPMMTLGRRLWQRRQVREAAAMGGHIAG